VTAFPLIRAKIPAARVVFVGDGPDRAWIEAQRERLDFAASIELAGPIAHTRLPTVLRDAALVCVPSYGEPFGMTILEAMAAGRAVVATDAGGPRHLLRDQEGGALVPVGDPSALARTCAELLLDRDLLARAGRGNRRRVEEEFSITRMIDRIEAVYRDLIPATTRDGSHRG
jgi:2-deoxystreptamine N-acetyl-D-glucosaminyltransferase/2-deoxystreptamine glucosyltransferase